MSAEGKGPEKRPYSICLCLDDRCKDKLQYLAEVSYTTKTNVLRTAIDLLYDAAKRYEKGFSLVWEPGSQVSGLPVEVVLVNFLHIRPSKAPEESQSQENLPEECP